MAVKVSNLFFWTKWVDKIIFVSFGWIILSFIIFGLPFLRVWWWVLFPIFLVMELKTLYLWWVAWDYSYAKTKWVVLEIIPPKEVLVPVKAMEDVFLVIWAGLFDSPNWRERWCEGSLPNMPYWLSFEIASIEGNVHFYARVTSQHRASVESALYAHYPDLEIQEVPDYTKDVPQNIPNEEWDAYGEDFILGREAFYPIKTYEKFFEPQGEKISAEEKRIDPIASLLESMAKLGSGEQFWLQFIISSLGQDEPNFKIEAEKMITKVAKRPEKKVKTFGGELSDIIYDIIVGPKKEGSGDKAVYKWIEPAKSEGGEREMVITAGEREVITEIENKLKKPFFRATIRGLYLAKRENWKSPNRILTRSYFAHFQTHNLNFMRFSLITRPKTHYVFRQRIPFLRKRRMLRNYVLRFPPLFPDRKKESPILNTEEMATLFHFPLKVTGITMPTMARVESKKGGPPPNLPIG